MFMMFGLMSDNNWNCVYNTVQ